MHNRKKLFDSVGVLFMLFSAIALSVSLVMADYQTYSFSWGSNFTNEFAQGGSRISYVRAGRLKSTTNANQYTSWACLGPAEWVVNGVVDGKHVQEVWMAPYFYDLPLNWDTGASLEYEYASMPDTGCIPNGVNGRRPPAGATALDWAIKQMGSYGALVMELNRWDNTYKEQWQTMSSQPQVWWIKGCVYDTYADFTQCRSYWQNRWP